MAKQTTTFKQFLKNEDMTIARLSRRSGITRQTIYNIINGTHKADLYTIDKLAKGLQITLDEMIELIENQFAE